MVIIVALYGIYSNLSSIKSYRLSWKLLECILWYSLQLSDPFTKNENSVLPILIEKNFEQKI